MVGCWSPLRYGGRGRCRPDDTPAGAGPSAPYFSRSTALDSRWSFNPACTDFSPLFGCVPPCQAGHPADQLTCTEFAQQKQPHKRRERPVRVFFNRSAPTLYCSAFPWASMLRRRLASVVQ